MQDELSALQKLVHENLVKQDPRLADMYLGALRVLRDKENRDRIPQSAHSIREISNVLTRKVQLGPEDDPKSNEKHKEKLIKMQDPRGELPLHILQPYDEWARLHNWFVGISHHEDGPIPAEEEFRMNLEKFELIIAYLLRPHFSVIREIDELLLKNEIGRNELEQAKLLIAKNSESYRYFFDKADENWLEPLIKSNFFTRPRATFKRDNFIFYPLWPESKYLARIASKRPKQVADTIVNCAKVMPCDDVNTRVLADFMEAAVNMPLENAKAIADLAIKKRWREQAFASILNQKTDELAVKFVEGGDIATGMDLLKSLLDVTINQANPQPSLHDVFGVIGDYEYEQVLKKTIPKVFDRYPVETIQFIASLLAKAILLSNKARKVEGDEDMSTAWRPAIEESDQNWNSRDTKDHLLTTLRYLIERSGQENLDTLAKVIAIIKKEKYSIFRRLETYVYRIFPESFMREIEEICVGKFGDYDTYHEYYMLIREQYPNLSQEARTKILEMIEKGPDVGFYVRRRTELDGEVPSQEKADNYVRNWKADKIEPILDYLPEEWKAKNSDLLSLVGKKGFSGFHSYHWIGRGEDAKSDLSDEMRVDDVIDFAKKYVPVGFYGGRDDSNARKFRDLVVKQPYEYSKRAQELKTAHPVMSYELISGLVEALRKEAKIEWDPVFDLCDYLTEKTLIQSQAKDDEYLAEGIADLIHYGCIRSKSGIPFSERQRVWQVVGRLDSLYYDDGTWADGYPDHQRDAYTIAINSANGRIMHALVAYAIWCFRGIQKEKGRGEFVNEAKARLEDHLDLDKDSNVSTRATLGFFFPQLASLSREWTAANCGKIFPVSDSKLADAAWESYLYNDVWEHAFNLLIPEYKARLDRAVQEDKGEKVPQQTLYLIDHITISHVFDLKGGDELFREFKHKAPPSLLDEVINYLWRTLKDDKIKTKISMDKIKAIWADAKFLARPQLTELFERSPLDRAFSISMLLKNLKTTKEKVEHSHRIVEEITGYAKEFPAETLECLELIVAADAKSWEIHFMKDYIRKIVRDIKSLKDEQLSQRCDRLVNFLGSLGYPEFGDLIG